MLKYLPCVDLYVLLFVLPGLFLEVFSNEEIFVLVFNTNLPDLEPLPPDSVVLAVTPISGVLLPHLL